MLPNDYQNPSFVIRAFNIEVAKVQDNVSDVSLGLARLQFWDDAIDKLYTDKVPAHPVVQEINKVNHPPFTLFILKIGITNNCIKFY